MAGGIRPEILAVCKCGRVFFQDGGRSEWTLLESIRNMASERTRLEKCGYCLGTLTDPFDPNLTRARIRAEA